ncbi:MAG: dipeptidyl-peptidase 4 [Acidimicrobiaceae bacterium]|nr:dipeptidyl-peptidase 4 [Acidimicrobiaceae bacterium]
MADPPSFEDIARLPAPGTSGPTAIAVSPDGTRVTYLLAGPDDLDRRLYALSLEDGSTGLLLEPDQGVTEQALSPEERLRRERQREYGLGVSSYAWAKDAPVLLTPLPDGVHVDGALRVPAPALDAQLSPDGSRVAFVREGELWVDDTPLTPGAADGLTYGLAEFIAQEEMARAHGFWWSTDGTRIAFTEVDERHIPEFRIAHLGSDGLDDEAHRYPFVGAANAKVRLGVVHVGRAQVTWLDLPDFEYLARVDWCPDGSLLVQTTDRAQQHLTLSRFDGTTRTTVLEEHSDVWINLHDLLRPLPDGRFLWASERSGFRHLYLYERDGTLIRQVTEGEWQVDSVDGIDAETGRVWFSATKEGPTERHLYEARFDDGGNHDGGGIHDDCGMRRLTGDPGTHQCTVSPSLGLFVDLHSSVRAQPTATVRRLADGAVVHPLFARPDQRVRRLGLRPPELGAFENRGGTRLHYAVFKPEDGSTGPWPTAVLVYGGPHAQLVQDAWALTAAMRAQHLRRRGFLVAVCDNRGSARRGLAFEGVLRGRLGQAEVDDQADFVAHLAAQGWADAERVGVYGWSYGGYMALMLLARAPDVFAAAVAGAPVTGWDGYDTHYTERYLGLVDQNEDGYAASAVFPYVGDMRGRLMVVHGLIDENVHFRHTARLANRLIAARHDYELLLFPDERHGPRKLEDRVYLEQRIAAFLEDALTGDMTNPHPQP